MLRDAAIVNDGFTPRFAPMRDRRKTKSPSWPKRAACGRRRLLLWLAKVAPPRMCAVVRHSAYLVERTLGLLQLFAVALAISVGHGM